MYMYVYQLPAPKALLNHDILVRLDIAATSIDPPREEGGWARDYLGVQSRRDGPPLTSGNFDVICNQLMPSHGGNSAQAGNGGYIITTNIPRSGSTGYGYTAGQTYTVTLSGGGNTFRGFIVKAHIPGQNNMLLGAFIPQNANQQTLDCDSAGAATAATVAHSNSAQTDFQSMTFMWQAPSGSDGTVDFRYSVVRMYSTFFVRQSAAANDPSPLPTNPPGQNTTAPVSTTTAETDPPGQTSATIQIPETSEPPTGPETSQPPPQGTTQDGSTTTLPSGIDLTEPVTAPEDYRLTFRSPLQCIPSECEIFVGIDTNSGNSGYLDIYLEGQADGWVAVGFSASPSMASADVVACNRDPSTNMVDVLDTWNGPAFSNEVDTIQDVARFSGIYSGGRITCRVAKKVAPSGTGQDLDLDNDYYVLYGRRVGSSVAGALTQHETGPTNNPLISLSTLNPVTLGVSTTTTESRSDTTTILSGLTAPVTIPEEYRLIFRIPADNDCAPSECDVFVGIGTNSGNSSYLDIYLEGQADGWVAVGFSSSPNMASADVVACNRNPATGMVEALDTWNGPVYSNEVDTIVDVQQFSGSYSGGRITCSVAKKIAPSGTGQDLDLNNDYYVLYGRSMGSSVASALRQHETGPTNNPLISLTTVNPVTAGGSIGVFPKLPVLRFHGILMIIAWPLLALYGIFFASWMRPVLPNGGWFQAHRAFLLASMFVGAAGFIVAFVANYPSGLISLGPSNPIISAFRCKPTGKFRWLFNLFHGTIIGTLAEVVALINVSLGTFLLFQSYSALFWVFIIYLVLYLVMFVVLLLLFTLTSCLSTDPDRRKLAPSLTKPLISSSPAPKSSGEKDIPLSQLDSTPKNDDNTKEKSKMSALFKDSNIRWASFFIFLAVSAPLILLLIGIVTVL